MSLTRQPQLELPTPDAAPLSPEGGLDPLAMLGALGNQAMQALLPVGQPGRDQPSPSGMPSLAWGDLWHDNFGAGDAEDLTSFGARGGLEIPWVAPFKPASPLMQQLLDMDPMETLARSGLAEDRWAAVQEMLTNKSAQSWGDVSEQLGPDISKILMGTAANKLIDQSMDENGLTTLYLESLSPWLRKNPDTSAIQQALTENMGGAVTKVINPTLDEMSALFDTDRVRDAVVAAHGLPGHLQLRLGDSWDFGFQNPTQLIESMGDSKNLRSVLLDVCYGAAGGQDSIYRRLADEGLAVMASQPILYGVGANKITQSAYEKIGQGMTPDKAFRATASEFNSVGNQDLEWQTRGMMSDWELSQWRASKGHIEGPETSAEIARVFGDESFFGINPIKQYGGSRATRAPTPVEGVGARPTSTGAGTAPEAPATTASGEGHFGLEAELPGEGGAPKIPKWNLLEDGLNVLGLAGGAKNMWEGGGALLGAFQGETDARTGTIGGANLMAGATDVAQNGLQLAAKVPQLAPWLAKSPLLRAFSQNKAIGMLSALPSVAGYGYDMVTGAADHQKALSGGEAVQGVASAAASTFGGPLGMVTSLGTALGEGVFNAFVPHAENAPTSLGQLGGMVDYSIDQVGLPQFFQDTVAEMAFDQRLEDPNADKASKDWAFASASMARLYLMADQGVHDLVGAGDRSMLHRILDEPGASDG